VARTCFLHGFDEQYARVLGTVNAGASGWLGCIKASGQAACAALLAFFRWFAMQNILNDQLYMKYSRVIVTRSDFLWVANHIHPSAMDPLGGAIWVPEGSDWGGLADRHYMW